MTKCPDRRAIPRFPVTGMTATLRVSGHFGRQDATVIDFNREGATLLLPEPIPGSRPIYLSLLKPPLRLDGIVGAIHNCRASEGGDSAAVCSSERRRCSSSIVNRPNAS